MGTPPSDELVRISDSEWTLGRWSCRFDTLPSSAIVYSCQSDGTRIETLPVEPEPEAPPPPPPPAAPPPESGAACQGALASGDPVRMAGLAVEAMNTGNFALVAGCVGSTQALDQLMAISGGEVWSTPTSCSNNLNNYECLSSDGNGSAIAILVYADGAGAQIQGIDGPFGGA